MKALMFVLVIFAVFCCVYGTFPQGIHYIRANGYVGVLNITSVAADGTLAGTAYEVPLTGFWSATTKKITFIRQIGYSPSTWQTYVGFQVDWWEGGPFFTGYFEAFSGTGATVDYNRFGWETIGGLLTEYTPRTVNTLLSGSNWTYYANDQSGGATLNFLSSGEMSGSLYETVPIVTGFWSLTTRQVVFVVQKNSDPSSQQLFRGYIYGLRESINGGHYLEIDKINGYLIGLAGAGGTADVNEFPFMIESFSRTY